MRYQVEHPLERRETFDEEDLWSVGWRLARPIGERLLLHNRYQYSAFDELFNEIRESGFRHETNFGGSVRLWSTASLSLSYSYLNGKLLNGRGTSLTDTDGHIGTANFTWPYTRFSSGKKRKLSFLPGLAYHISDLGQSLRERPLLTGRLGLGYEVYQDWRLELMGEFRYDEEDEDPLVRTEQSRLWLLWTSTWK